MPAFGELKKLWEEGNIPGRGPSMVQKADQCRQTGQPGRRPGDEPADQAGDGLECQGLLTLFWRWVNPLCWSSLPEKKPHIS